MHEETSRAAMHRILVVCNVRDTHRIHMEDGAWIRGFVDSQSVVWELLEILSEPVNSAQFTVNPHTSDCESTNP